MLAQTIQNGAGTASYTIDQAGRDNQIGVLSLGGTTPLTTSYAYDGAGDTTAITGSSTGVGSSATMPRPAWCR